MKLWYHELPLKDLEYTMLVSINVRVCLRGGGGPRVGEVTRLDGVTRLSIF